MNTKHTLRLAACALLASASYVSADTYTWVPAAAGAWDLSAANWNDGVSSPVAWVNGNDAAFTSFASVGNVALGVNITASSLSTNGGATIGLTGSGTLDVPVITTAGSSAGGAGSLDVSVKLTGNHGLAYSSTGAPAGSQGRLNLKVAADYTGDTVLSGSAYLNLDGSANNLLPTTTVVTLNSGTTMRYGRNGNASHQIAGLSGSGTVLSQSGTSANANVHTLRITTSSANSAQSFTGALNNTFSTLALEIAGDGTQTIGGSAKAFSGSTSILGGTLILDASLTNSASVTISGGTLTSSVANVNLGAGGVSISSGTLRPRGSAAGTFTVAANQNFTATGGVLDFGVGTGTDQIIGSGTGAFSISATTLALTLGSGFDYANSYQLFSGFASGSVTGLTITGYDTANWTAALSNTGQLSFVSAIPEPSSAAVLAGLCSLGLVALRRRRAVRG